ncbi:MAG: ABC transporter permease [Actinomycetes bacterium]
MTSRVRAVLDRREVLRLLVARDLKLKYERSALGYLWTTLEPLLLATIYWFVFEKVFDVGIDNYVLVIICGILPWLWFSGTVSQSTGSLAGQARLVTSTSLPREIWVLRAVGSKAVEFVFSLPVLLLFVLVTGVSTGPGLLLFPVAFLIQITLLTGVALLLSTVAVVVPDVKRLIRVVMRVFFYMSPVLYPSGRVPEPYQWAYELNPLVGIIEAYRAAWFPEYYAGHHLLTYSAVVAVVVLLLGWRAFARLERVVLKEL